MFHVERFSTLRSLCWVAQCSTWNIRLTHALPWGTHSSIWKLRWTPNFVSGSAGLESEPARRRSVPRGTLVRSVPHGTLVWKDGKEFSVAGFDSAPSANSAVAPKYVIAIGRGLGLFFDQLCVVLKTKLDAASPLPIRRAAWATAQLPLYWT